MGDGRGDAARLRKGLFDEKLAVRPGDGSLSLSESVVDREDVLADGRRVVCLGERFRRCIFLSGKDLKHFIGDVDL